MSGSAHPYRPSARVVATSLADTIDEDRPSVWLSSGLGNLSDAKEIYLQAVDPMLGTEISMWVKRDELLAAIVGLDDWVAA
jgi:hypothetical protein